MISVREDIRNIAIIAHVDHGKTTLVDELLRQSGTFRENQEVVERVMDSNDLERERGITILSKNTAINYNGTKINIIDTPGHADFGGEVERVLKMVDGVILVVDAFEGPMPQTKFVLKNSLDLNLPVIVCINKIDRPDARPEDVVDEVLMLFMELDSSDEQLNAPFVYASAKKGFAYMAESGEQSSTTMAPLFEAILKYIPAPKGNKDSDLQMLITTLDYNEYVGRIGIGKIENGTVSVNDEVVIANIYDTDTNYKKVRITKLFEFEGLERVSVDSASFGSIVALSGIESLKIGDTICSVNNPVPIEFNKISEPTISMTFSVNDSPFAGREGNFVTSRHLRNRLYKELYTDVSLRVEDGLTTESFIVSGRGELHLSILIETMRREGYEFAVSKPVVLFKEIDGKTFEPYEIVTVDVPEVYAGSVIEKLSTRRGEMTHMSPPKNGNSRLTFSIPSRGLMGYRSEFLTDTKGTGILNAEFDEYKEMKGAIPARPQGSLIAFADGDAVPYGLYNAQERGDLFIGAGVKVYAGMLVGRNAKAEDIEVNVCKRKQQTNMRASGSDESLRLSPPLNYSLEQCLQFIADDELLEVTPKSLRMRKRILDSGLRKRNSR